MFFFRNEHLTVLLCVLSGSLVFASLNNDIKKIGTSSTNIVSYLPVWWKEEIKLAAQSSKSTCAAEVLAVIHAVESGQTWAMQMLDASSGFLKGNMLDLRTYVECVKVNKQYNNVSIRGKHCMVSFMSGGDIFIPAVSRVNDRIFSSVCFPSSCNETQVEQIINATLRNIPMKRNLGFSSTEALCARVETEDFSAGKISTIMLVVAVGVFLISCTVCDVYVRSRGPAKASSVINKFSKFSLYTNILKIFDSKELPAIQGIRVLSMCWIVTIHQSFMLFLVPTVNRADIDKWYDSWTSLYAEAGIFAVDTFFLVSGFLTAHSFFMARKLGKPINWRRFYLHRYLRLTPCLAFVMLFTSFLARWNGNNPLGGQFVATSVENCHDNWWVNLLYLQNFLNKEKMVNAGINWTIACVLMLFCMVSTHYISNTNVRYNLALETIFALTSRPFWSIAVAWIVYACTQGYGGPVTSFLSLPFFQPLSRFSYSIFLVHIGIQAIRIADARTLAFVANSTIIEAYITNMVLSIGVGVIVYLFFETPAAVLENILTNRVLEANQALQTEEFEEKTRILNEAAKDK
ncbi:nose resistant to fluoxetine protein 6-like isoform X2 [Diprion similis]|uniref:nose resistant to fluoxetine protein 6-like isoform X2 n=1 Tax=Diprion similis TaxID=362088 RepID=UPI001EF75DAE|nr:nose resistant to fluoxetine protein 6-like isoform X2 [Diprion similis]